MSIEMFAIWFCIVTNVAQLGFAIYMVYVVDKSKKLALKEYGVKI